MHLPDAIRLPTLEGERVRLRQLDDADVHAVFAVFGDPVVARYWATPALVDETAAAELVEQTRVNFRARTGFRWAIATRDDDDVIGTCSLFHLDAANRRAEVGYALGRAYWRRGYATEAITIALTFGYETLGLRRIEADVDPRNAASLRTLERLGFQREGLLRACWEVNGEVQDSVILGLLADEWRAAQADGRRTTRPERR